MADTSSDDAFGRRSVQFASCIRLSHAKPGQEGRSRMISLDEFRRLDVRIGEIVSAVPIVGSNRLLRVEVDLGTERRVLVAGLARHYTPESLVGLQVAVLANFEPAVIQGVESQGMLLGAACGTAPALLTVNQAVDNGTPVQ